MSDLLLMAPLSVKLEFRGFGVGAKLIHHAMEEARLAGFNAIVLCGDPAYYSRFGFHEAAAHQLHFKGVPDLFF